VSENDVAGVREKYLARLENSRYWGRLLGLQLLPAPANRSLLRWRLWSDGMGRGTRLTEHGCARNPLADAAPENSRSHER